MWRPPAAPTVFKQVRFGSDIGGEIMFMDFWDEPALGQTKVWPCVAEMLNYGATECRNVIINWDLGNAGG